MLRYKRFLLALAHVLDATLQMFLLAFAHVLDSFLRHLRLSPLQFRHRCACHLDPDDFLQVLDALGFDSTVMWTAGCGGGGGVQDLEDVLDATHWRLHVSWKTFLMLRT